MEIKILYLADSSIRGRKKNDPKEPTKKGPLSYEHHESPLASVSVSTVSRAPLSGLSGWKILESKYEDSISYEEMHDESFAPNRSHTFLFSLLTM